MKAIRGLLWIFPWTAVVCCAPRQVSAQQPVAAILAHGRRQLDELKPDSAALILVRVLDPSAGASQAEKVRALVLLGIAELTLSQTDEARRDFERALALDQQLRVDTLAHLHSFLLTTFESVRLPLGVYPERVVDTRPSRSSTRGRFPCQPATYPWELIRARIQGQVVLRFVIDTLGRVEPSSLEVVRADNRGFVEPARRFVLSCRYTPGEIQGRPVRVQVTLPVDFRLGPPGR